MQSTDPLLRDGGPNDVALDQGAIVKPWLGDVVKSTVAVAGRDIQITQINGNLLSVQQEFWPDFSDLIADKTRWFVGRGFVFQALAKFMQDEPRGYFRIIADAGLGKSAIAAELASRYRAPAYFFSTTEGRVNPETALDALSAQLIVRYGLPHTTVPVSAGATSDFVYQRMKEAVAAAAPSERIVIVIDALDEADAVRPGHNWLHLPKALPDRVYVVLTSRPFHYQLQTDGGMPPRDLVISRDDAGQRQDVEDFLRNQARRPEIQAALAAATPPVSAADFVTTLASRSEGNFMYLTYVLGSFVDRENERAPLRLEELPTGLTDYYSQFWDQMKPPISSPDEYAIWQTVYRPVIEFLGVALEPVTVAWLGAQIGQDPGQIRTLALKRWMRFLSWRTSSGTETWQIVHRSFAEFLNDQARVDEVDLVGANRAVADYYTTGTRWRNWSAWDKYGLRHVASHLAQSVTDAPDGTDRVNRLDRLVTLTDNAGFRRVHLDTLHAPDALQRDLERALDLAVQIGPGVLPLMMRAASAVGGFRAEVLDPADLFKHAAEGLVDAANRQLSLYDIERGSEWEAALRVIIAWLGYGASPVAARALWNRSQSGTPGPTLDLLQRRVEAVLDGLPQPPLPPLPPPPPPLLAEAMVARLAGTTDAELQARAAELLAAQGGGLAAGGGSLMGADDIEFLAQADGPLLVSLAIAAPPLGDDFLDQYLKVHSRYSYTTYRRGSLWMLLHSILSYPDLAWVRVMAVAVGRTALVGGDVEFEEATAFALMAVAAQSGNPAALGRLRSRYEAPEGPLGPLQDTAAGSGFGPNMIAAPELLARRPYPRSQHLADRWGVRKRRLGTLAEATSVLFGDRLTARQLVQRALDLPFGFAGYQAPATLSLAESILVAVGPDYGLIQTALDAAREAAHNVQDPTLCARTTARVNAARARWWAPAPGFAATDAAQRLRAAAASPEFAAVHVVGETYQGRAETGSKPLPLSMIQARTLSALAVVYQRPLSEFLRLNPQLPADADALLPPGIEVNVPDARFVTMVAARVAAQALGDPTLAPAQRLDSIWNLVPVAASNPTSLDTVLSRLVLAAAPIAAGLLPALELIGTRGASRTAESSESPVVNLPS